MYQYNSLVPLGMRIQYRHVPKDSNVSKVFIGTVCGIGEGCVFVNPVSPDIGYWIIKVRLEHIISPDLKKLFADSSKSKHDLFTRSFIQDYDRN